MSGRSEKADRLAHGGPGESDGHEEDKRLSPEQLDKLAAFVAVPVDLLAEFIREGLAGRLDLSPIRAGGEEQASDSGSCCGDSGEEAAP